ncbi:MULTISPECIES: hypothetical protein [Brevibacterium]|uniref:hypothetical protein n=1 Tax=Brevibacterium TaxID=1696 RepID=UPI001C68B913|nr:MULTISPECIES: hypothetical protein [Brevibacterium]
MRHHTRSAAGSAPAVRQAAHRRRTLIWTPDASRALAALGNAPDAYGQAWHLPVDDSHRELVAMAAERPRSESPRAEVNRCPRSRRDGHEPTVVG